MEEPQTPFPKVSEVQQQDEDDNSIDSSFDGGVRAWATLVGGFTAITASLGYASAFGVYQDVYTRAGLASASRISWVGSTQLFLGLTVGIIGGKLLDMGHFRVMLLAATLLQAFSIFMVSLAHHDQYYQIFLSQGLGVGIGSGLLYVPSLAIQGQHWKKRRALAMGFVASGTAVGGIAFPIMLNQLFKGSVGFEWGVRASGFTVLGLLIISNILMSENPALKSIQKPKPNMKSIITDVPYVLTSVACLPITFGIFFPYFYVQLYSILHGVDPDTAFYMLAIMSASSLFGRTYPSYLADRYGPFNVFIPASLGSAILIFIMPRLRSEESIIIFSILYGFFSGAFLALPSPVIASMCRDESEFGWATYNLIPFPAADTDGVVSVRFGLGFAGTGLGALVGNPISGALLGHEFLWWKAAVFNGVLMLTGVFLLLIARHLNAKRKKTRWL